MTLLTRKPYELGPMPLGMPMQTLDRRLVRAPVRAIFDVARRVEYWPAYLPHYRFVRFRERFDIIEGIPSRGIVEMSAYRPFFGPLGWPTWWMSEMVVDFQAPSIRFFHVGGVTKGMDVEWRFTPTGDNTEVEILHVWSGPKIPLGVLAATTVIGPVFVHGIASRTLEGLATMAERETHRRIAKETGA